jgi:hypothetical protein
MLSYPSIARWQESRVGEPCLAFYKYDGSNLRWEWTPKRKWHKFGSRHQLFDHTSEQFAGAIPLFMETMADDIEKIILDEYRSKTQRIVAFTEFFGPSSFAGTHIDGEPKQLKLIDVSIYKQGFLPARKFVKLFGHLDYTAKIVYEGNMNQPFIQDVRNGMYPVYEGVVCKGDGWSAKVKTIEYLNRLKGKYGDNWEQYE